LAGSRVPDDRGTIRAGGDDAGSVGTERSAIHCVLMLEWGREGLPGSDVPDTAVWSKLAVTTRDPSGLNTARITQCWCSSGGGGGLPGVVSQTRAVWSELAVTTWLPSGL